MREDAGWGAALGAEIGIRGSVGRRERGRTRGWGPGLELPTTRGAGACYFAFSPPLLGTSDAPSRGDLGGAGQGRGQRASMSAATSSIDIPSPIFSTMSRTRASASVGHTANCSPPGSVAIRGLGNSRLATHSYSVARLDPATASSSSVVTCSRGRPGTLEPYPTIRTATRHLRRGRGPQDNERRTRPGSQLQTHANEDPTCSRNSDSQINAAPPIDAPTAELGGDSLVGVWASRSEAARNQRSSRRRNARKSRGPPRS